MNPPRFVLTIPAPRVQAMTVAAPPVAAGAAAPSSVCASYVPVCTSSGPACVPSGAGGAPPPSQPTQQAYLGGWTFFPSAPAPCACPRGEQGAVGPAGADGSATIIPIASGTTTVSPVTALDGSASGVSLVGFGTSVDNVVLTTPTTLDTTGIAAYDFVVTRDGTITGFAGKLVTTLGLIAINGTMTVTAHLFRAITPTTVFTEIARVDLAPSLTGILIPAGLVLYGSTDSLNIGVEAGHQLLYVVSVSVEGATAELVQTINGFFSGGITIQ